MHIEIGYDGSGKLATFANSISVGVQKGLAVYAFSAGAASYWLQVQRTGNNWVISYSTNGTSYTQVGSFSYTLNVTALGVYADNYGATASQAAAFNGTLDLVSSEQDQSILRRRLPDIWSFPVQYIHCRKPCTGHKYLQHYMSRNCHRWTDKSGGLDC